MIYVSTPASFKPTSVPGYTGLGEQITPPMGTPNPHVRPPNLILNCLYMFSSRNPKYLAAALAYFQKYFSLFTKLSAKKF